MTMRAAFFEEFGGPEVIRVGELAVPEPGDDEVRIRVEAAALNHLDLWVRRGLPIEITMPHIGGSDIVGVVEALGDDVDSGMLARRVVVDPSVGCGECPACLRGNVPLCPDYRIIGEHLQGGFAEYVVVPAANVYPVPDAYPLEQAAAAPLAFLTAWRALTTRGGVCAGEDVLVTGASGGVSTAAIQIAKLAGARVHAVTRTEHIERVRQLGVDFVYDRTQVDFSKEVWKATNRNGVDLIIDSVGETFFEGNVRALKRGGRMVIYGATTGPKPPLDLRLLFWKQIDIRGSTMSGPSEFRQVMDLVFGGKLAPIVDTVLPLEQARAAHERLEAAHVFGKIVLRP